MISVNGIMEVVFVTDENYALPTGVAITSLKENRNITSRYNVHVLGVNIKPETMNRFCSMSDKHFSVDVKPIEDFFDFSSIESNTRHVSRAAIFKFIIPQIFPELPKILYLDADVLVMRDLKSLFFTDIDEYYLAAVKDMRAIVEVNINETLGLERNYYFNSGVMLLNLTKMRNDNIADKLIEYRKNGVNIFQDQDAFNVIMGCKLKLLPLKYNDMITMYNKERPFSKAEIAEYYGISVGQIKTYHLYNTVILHLTDIGKPWNQDLGYYTALFKRYQNKSCFKDVSPCYCNANDGTEKDCAASDNGNDAKSLNQKPKRICDGMIMTNNTPRISIVIPAFNVEKYISECLDSVIEQPMDEIEIICINDGSTDNTENIIKEYQETDHRIILISQQNNGLSFSRNIGKDAAKGKYILFLDADDKLAYNALEILYDKAEANDADVCLFSSKPFLDSENVKAEYKHFCESYQRNGIYNTIENGREMFRILNENGDYLVNVGFYLVKREFLTYNNISFYNGIVHEDNLYTFMVLMHAERVGFVNSSLNFRRVREGSIMTQKKTFQNVYGYFICGIQMIKYLFDHTNDASINTVIIYNHVSIMFNSSVDIFKNLDKKEKACADKLDPYEKWLFTLLVKNNADNKTELRKRDEKLNKKSRELEKIKNSKSYRLAQMMAKPIRKLKKTLMF